MAEIVETDGVLGGQPRLDGHRISVLQIHEWVIHEGQSPSAIATNFDLDVADVYRALTYYYDNIEQMRNLREEQERAVREGIESQPGPEDFADEAEPKH